MTDNKTIYYRAIKLFGVNLQKTIAIEEMSELIKEICKDTRSKTYPLVPVASEIADVEIMIEQLKIIYNCADLVKEIKRNKIQRLAERIDTILKDQR